MIKKDDKIYIAGHNGLVGRAIYKKLKNKGYKKLIVEDRKKLDLTDQSKVYKFLKKNKPKFIFILAAKVGGIFANINNKADYIYENIIIQSNLIHGAFKCGVKNIIFLGSSCIYPKYSKQPMKEKYILTGKLEETNDSYSIAKIAGIKMCESYNQQYKTNYKSLIPSNIIGPNDNYDKLNSHFIPAIIRKTHNIKMNKSKNLIIFGNGKAKREIIYVDDVADACIYFMNKKIKESYINVGTGKDFTITEYAKKIIKIVLKDKKVKIKFDKKKPNGMPRKVLNINLAKKYGWQSKISIDSALKKTYFSYIKNKNTNNKNLNNFKLK